MKKSVITLFVLFAAITAAFADEITFTAQAPKSVVANQQFRLTYKVSTTDTTEPTIKNVDGIRIVAGPYSSTQQSMQSINGKTTYSSSVTYTFILEAEKEGEFTIPAATITAEGKRITSNSVSIRVLPDDGSSPSSHSGNTVSRPNSSRTDISDDDLFIVASLNKTKVYEQEAVLLTYKVYTNVNLLDLSSPMPDLKDFHTQEIELPKQKTFELDRYNGRNYQSLVWRQFVLFPQKSGKIEIPSLDFETLVAVQTRRNMDPFEMMFNGGPSYVEVRKKVKTNKLVLDVQSLPAGKPVAYSGGVGTFSISSQLNRSEFKTNEEFTLKITVKGSGNLKLIGTPEIDFPSDFYVFDPIINNDIKLRSNGFTGEKVYEYIITPKTSGIQTIPAARMSYFDTTTGEYRTIETESYTIDVQKGKDTQAVTGGTYVAKEEGKILASDIRHIKSGESSGSGNDFFASATYCLTYLVALILFALYITVRRKRMAANADVVRVRTKRASKVAVGRLKTAKRLMAENNTGGFYDEILKALWGYMSDKLNIPVSRLTKDNISAMLNSKNAGEETIAELESILNECEFARYAPGDPAETMDKIYTKSIEVISKMENRIK